MQSAHLHVIGKPAALPVGREALGVDLVLAWQVVADEAGVGPVAGQRQLAVGTDRYQGKSDLCRTVSEKN